jgi:uncharacterized glyoxalase superfamily protein PhnB
MLSKQLMQHTNVKAVSAVFITFSGNCKQALKFYQTCFGGSLQFDVYENQLPGFSRRPVVSGYLDSEKVAIRGSDLVQDEGRKLGNHMAIYLQCSHQEERNVLIKKLELGKANRSARQVEQPKLLEITDVFGVRWVLGI